MKTMTRRLVWMVCGLSATSATAQLAPRVEVSVETSRGEMSVLAPDLTTLNRVVVERVVDHGGRVFDHMPAPDPIVLTDELIIRTDDVAALGTWLSDAGFDGVVAQPIAGVSGIGHLVFGNVAAAIEAQAALEAAGFGPTQLLLDEPMRERGGDPGDPIDPLFPDQWYILNELDTEFDCHADAAWDLGYTGDGILVGVVEATSGWLVTHEDLVGNYNATAGNTVISGTHATNVAGIIGAVGFNNLGVRGIAYESEMSSIYIGTTGATRAAALALNNDVHHLKNNSWGPTDNGNIFQISMAEMQALEDAATMGRGGLGTIMCWAAGNGGSNDRMDYDGFANNRHTIAVGWITSLDVRSAGSEAGAALMCVAHSSGGPRAITTTSTNVSGYRSNFGGSSAACPVLSGTVALMLEANPALTWRDVQHILVDTVRMNDPLNPSWETNGAGHDMSYEYGFGAVETFAAVDAASTWTSVDDVVTNATTKVVDTELPNNVPAGLTSTITVTEDMALEHVEVTLNVTYPFIGDLEIELTAPSGTTSLFALERFDSQDDYTDFTFMSVRHWDESAVGDWTLRISDLGAPDVGTWDDWTLTLHGTAVTPVCPGDVNGDLMVNFLDLDIMLDNWGATVPANTMGDLDGDGMVTFTDLNELLDKWAQSCE